MTELPVHKKELIKLSKDFERVFPGFELHTLSSNDSENSMLYHNTLPVSIKQPKVVEIVNANQEIEWTNLNQAYTYVSDKS